MADRYAAFISYAHRDKGWVEALQRNLERCLEAAGRPWKVFLDEVDLASGRSWVGQLQAGLDRSGQLILVATPESLASPRVADEWRSFVAARADWHDGRLHIAHLVDVPFPPFLGQIQHVDFRNTAEDRYRLGLQKLVAGLLGQTDGRDLPALPGGIEIPSPPWGRLDPALRAQLVGWLTPVLEKKVNRLALALALGFQPGQLEGQDSWACAASAALVWASGQEEPVTAALRIVETLQETLGEDEPERVAALSPLRAELAARRAESPDRSLLATWLDCVARDHEHLVPLQEQVALTLLDRVYVQLAVRPDLRRTGDPAAPARLDQTPTLRDLLALDRGEHPWITGRWVVLGDPGAGKTTLLRHLAGTLARREDRPWVPLFESLPRLLRDRASLLDRAVRRLERAGHPAQGLAEALERTGRAGRLLLLLDGLDEVPKESREEAEQLLGDLAVRWPDSPLVVTSRPIGYRPPGSGFREVELLPLDHGRRRELLARWFGRADGTPDEARADRALQALDAPELQEVAGNPLYLTLMALLFEQEIAPGRNRTRLYDQVFDLLLRGKHRRPEAEPMEPENTVRALLRRLASGMTEDNKDAEPVAALEDRLYRPEMDALRATLERVGRWRGRLHSFLDELAEKTGILGPHDGPDADWRFWHRTFREALTAESLQDQFQEQGGRAAVLARAKAVTSEEDLSRWAEPFALLAGRVPDPDDLVKALVQENRPLGLRALATAQSLRVETLREVLALSEEWEERAEVYRRLPELVGEPRRALALIDQLRRKTRNGNDLHFLDSATREVGRLSPDHAGEVTALLARFFDHVPQPPEELFQWIETPLDGRVPLWREIPAGSFWMGSPKGEGHDFERPRHQVTITSPFRCGAVPIINAQYAAFDPDHEPYGFEGVPPEELPHHPVESITWFEAISFCRWLSASFPWARDVRLPTEEEWEYACRAGSQTRYWKGEEEKDLAAVGWYDGNSEGRTHRVGEKPANPWGLYDVHGNVWEWTLSPWTGSYEGREGGATVDPASIEVPTGESPGGARRVVRGGGYWVGAGRARAACRGNWVPDFENVHLGFRVVLPAGPEPRTVGGRSPQRATRPSP
ncbi:MAG TPA: SUMF1/EgtB/PvdO family nonheme iron enzyme [Thermoanaerobaculia bacterium]|nr:SUMF1/EgtB/PvdO family nonheme iron enzyme [Thermoanaerobaculia bacterium]